MNSTEHNETATGGSPKGDIMRQKEGFCLMLYKCEGCEAIEVLWNSRDKVTPFMITCRYCKGYMQHAEWQLDTYAPDFKPHKGMRIFIDLTEMKNKEYITAQVNRYWEHGPYCMKDRYVSKASAVNELTKGGVREGEPDVEEVT